MTASSTDLAKLAEINLKIVLSGLRRLPIDVSTHLWSFIQLPLSLAQIGEVPEFYGAIPMRSRHATLAGADLGSDLRDAPLRVLLHPGNSAASL